MGRYLIFISYIGTTFRYGVCNFSVTILSVSMFDFDNLIFYWSADKACTFTKLSVGLYFFFSFQVDFICNPHDNTEQFL